MLQRYSLRLRLCQLRLLRLHFRGRCQFQPPHSLPKSGKPLMQPSSFCRKLLEIRRRHLPAESHRIIDLMMRAMIRARSSLMQAMIKLRRIFR